MDLSEQPGSGAAQRRRQRRLRSWLRHERMTVAMALAESTHHSSRGQKTAMARVWGREMNYTATIQDPPHTSQSSSACTKSLAPRGLTGSPVPQTAEQLVEAPNVMSLIGVIRHPVEQTVGGGRIGGLPGFLPGQSYSLSAEQIVDNQSSFPSWFWWRSSWFTPRTEFSVLWSRSSCSCSDCRAER